jgi:hypothetical protein
MFVVEEQTEHESSTKRVGSRDLALPKHTLAFNGLYGVISQKMELFKTSVVRISVSKNRN